MNESTSESLEKGKYQVYSYRWVILLLFVFVGMMTSVIWVTFSARISVFANYYTVSENWIKILGFSYMIMYIPVNFPACYLIDKYGLKWGVGIGVILTGVFGFLRGIFAENFIIVTISQFMCAVGQPFILNSFTKMAVTWFPESEKATAAGLGTISTLIGNVIGLMIPEFIEESQFETNIPNLLLIYGIFCLLSAIVYYIFIKEEPITPPNPYATKTKVLVTKGLKSIFKNRSFIYLMIAFFFALGVFNAFTSEIETIFSTENGYDPGIIGACLIGGGILGAIILPIISDQKNKRKIFIIIAMIASSISSLLMGILESLTFLFIIAFCFGFLLIAALPIGLTYAAEITYPVQEEVSSGVLFWLGQISGVIFFIIPPDLFMFFAAGLFALSVIASFFLQEKETAKSPLLSS